MIFGLVAGLVFQAVNMVSDKYFKKETQTAVGSAETLILTPRYLVELSDDICAIIPLPEVLWIYDHAAMRRTIKGRQLSYTIHVVTMKGEEYTLTGKSHREVSAIYHELNTRYPNFFFGYSKEHQEMVQYVLHEMKNEKT